MNSTHSTFSNAHNNNNTQQHTTTQSINTLSEVKFSLLKHAGVDVEPKIIYDLFTSLTETKNKMVKDIKKYITKYEKLNIEHKEYETYKSTYDSNIKKLTKSYNDMNETLNSINESFELYENKELLIKVLKDSLMSLKSSFDSFVYIFVDTRTYFKNFQKDNKKFKGYTLMNKLFSFNVNITNLNKIHNIINKMIFKNYLTTLYTNALNELNRVKNRYEFKFATINYVNKPEFSNMIFDYINKFNDVFMYKIFIMKLLNLKFYLSRIESFKELPEYDENGILMTLEEMKHEEFTFLKDYQEEPLIINTFKPNSTLSNIKQTLINFVDMIEGLDDKFDNYIDKIKEFNIRFKEIKAHLKDIFKQVNKVINVKEGKILNKQGIIFIDNLVNELNKVYKITINKNDFSVVYPCDIDINDLKEHHENEHLNDEMIDLPEEDNDDFVDDVDLNEQDEDEESDDDFDISDDENEDINVEDDEEFQRFMEE